MMVAKLLISALACLSGLLYTNAAKADVITIDYENTKLIYEDTHAGIKKEYKAVLVRDSKKYVYGKSLNFDIDLLLLNPSWKSPSGLVYSSNHPRNPMGAGIIRFASKEEGYSENCSIHGGAREKDKGQYLSGCCVRLSDDEFMELFMNISPSTIINLKL